MPDTLTKEINDEIAVSEGMANRYNWSNGILTAIVAVATAAATICTAAGLSANGGKYYIAILAALPGFAIGLQRTWRLEARTAWHTERLRRLQALRRARGWEGLSDLDASKALTSLDIELEARWQAAQAHDGGEKPAFHPMLPPSDAKERIDTALQQRADAATLIHDELVSDDVVTQLAGGQDKEATKAALTNVAKRLVSKAKDATSITIELPGGEIRDFPMAAAPTFNALTDLVYFESSKKFEPYTYGTRWRLLDKDGRPLRHAREITKAGPGMPIKDTRTLAEVGIAPGDALKVELLPESGAKGPSR